MDEHAGQFMFALPLWLVVDKATSVSLGIPSSVVKLNDGSGRFAPVFTDKDLAERFIGKFFREEDREKKGCVGLLTTKALRVFLLDMKRLGCVNVILDFEMDGPWHGNRTGVDEFIGLLDAQLG